MSTISAIQKTIEAQNKAKAIKVEPNSADTSLVDGKEVGVLVSGSNGTTGIYSGSVTVEAGDSGHGRLGGDATISSGDGTYAGKVYVLGGANLTEPPLQHFGGIFLETGGVGGGGTSTTSTGLISIYTGDVSAPTAHSGYITIKSGSPHNHTDSTSGNITIETGGTTHTTNAGTSGFVKIETGRGGTDESGKIELITGPTSTASSGNVIVNTGSTTTASSGTIGLSTGDSSNGGDSGAISMSSGTTALAGTSGSVTIQSGDPAGSGSSGNAMLRSGNAAGGSSGSVFIKSGSSETDSGTVYLFSENAGRNTGALEMRTGNSTINGNSGAINLYTGTATNNTHSSGAISIYSGEGHTTSGALDLYSGISNLTSGAVSLHSGNATSTESGAVSIYSGDSTSGNSGAVSIKSGTSGNGNTDRSGGITIQTGDSTFQSGTILIKAGESSSSGGHVQLVTSNVTDPSAGSSGTLWFQTGSQVSSSDTGSATLKTGDNTGTGLSGKIDIYTGDADGDNTGGLEIKTGFTPADGFASGEITISTGGKENSGGTPIAATSSDLADSGDLTIRTGNTYDGTVGNIEIKTGDRESLGGASFIGGDITIETSSTKGRADYDYPRTISLVGGDHDGAGWDTTLGRSGRAGEIELRGGRTYNSGEGKAGSISLIAGSCYQSPVAPYTWNRPGTVSLTGGLNTDPSTGSYYGDIYLNGGSTYYPTRTTLNETSKVQIRGGNIAFNSSALTGFGSKTKKGGDVEIRGGDVRNEFNSSTGYSADDGSGTQDLGEVKIISGSVPTSSVNNRIMTVQADGVLKSSGVQILGHGELYYTPTTNISLVTRLPISFSGTRASPIQNTIGSSGVDYYQTNNYNSNPRYDTVFEWYEGTPIIDHSTTITGAMDTAANAQSGTPYYKHEANPWASDVSTEVSTSVGVDYYTGRKLRILVSVIYDNVNPDVWRSNRQYTYGTPMLSPSVGLLHQGISSGGWIGWTCELIWRTPGLNTSGGPGIYNYLTGAGSTIRVSYLVYQVD
jgi:hypothetical protein